SRIDPGRRELLRRDLRPDLVVRALEAAVAPELVDGAPPRRLEEPRARPLGDARRRPLLERDHERVLRQLLGAPEVPDDAGEGRDEARRFDSPHRLDRVPRRRVASGHCGPRLRFSSMARVKSASLAAISGPKSAASKIWRSSSVSPSSAGQRFAHSTASAFDFTCQIQYPPISSRVSVKGPSVTVRLPPPKRMRADLADGWSPSSASSTPA